MNKKRLVKLAEHLEKGKLGHKKFSFAVYNVGATQPKSCGTMGCAIGELPILFPKLWTWDSYNDPSLRKKEYPMDTRDEVQEFFGLDLDEIQHLFYPYQQNPQHYGGKILGDDATRKQVAKGIREFIKIKESESK